MTEGSIPGMSCGDKKKVLILVLRNRMRVCLSSPESLVLIRTVLEGLASSRPTCSKVSSVTWGFSWSSSRLIPFRHAGRYCCNCYFSGESSWEAELFISFKVRKHFLACFWQPLMSTVYRPLSD